jgi:ribonuclease Y
MAELIGLLVVAVAVAVLAILIVQVLRRSPPAGPVAPHPPASTDVDPAVAELADRRQQLDRREQRVAEREQRLEAEQSRVETRDHQLAGVDRDLAARQQAVDNADQQLERRELRLTEREQRIDTEHRRIDEHDRTLAEADRDLLARQQALAAAEHERIAELERIAGLTAAAAKAELVVTIETQAKREAALLVRDLEAAAREDGDRRARAIVTSAIQRIASEQTAESVVTVFHLPSDDMKGRIIGREGRNIRAFESITGVNVIIDDTPEAVLLSCFDPVRREVGRLTLDKLVLDGRIHPHRIEEQHALSVVEVQKQCIRAGEDAVLDVGLADIHPELVTLLGQLRYRTSYGQNVLKHLVESAHLAGMMAAELGLDVDICKRCAFLHDIGKALTHEVQGSHAIIGAELARKYGEPEDICHAIEAHHNEVEVHTVEAVLTQAADAISGGRPGARRESLEHYVQRLVRIEEIAGEQPGVEKVFAMQAGREIRVMVKPDEVDDIGAQVIARDVAKQIEEELTYPGQIRVTVVRESRATEVAK